MEINVLEIGALIAALSLGLGKGFQYTVEATEAKEVPTAVDAIVGLFPKNLINEWGSNTVVPILVFGLIVALAYNKVVRKDESVKPFKAFVDAANTVLGRTVRTSHCAYPSRFNRNSRSSRNSYDHSNSSFHCSRTSG